MKLDAAFDFFGKLGLPFWCFHDRDVAPEGATLAESNRILDRPARSRCASKMQDGKVGNCSGARPTCSPTAAS